MEETKVYENCTEKRRCVCAAPVARRLIRKGHQVVDIKPNRADYGKTVFVFKRTDEFDRDFEDALNAYGGKGDGEKGKLVSFDLETDL